MAYTKTTWNNLSDPPINAENLNKIEQGIYNNSLGIDKINPSGTATTTAEIEEGQVNDVIGFKSLKLKGQTSQYTTTGKNFLKPTGTSSSTSYGITRTTNSDGSVTLSGTASADTYLRISDFLTLESNTAYTTLNQNANLPTGVIIYYNDVSNIGVTYNDTVIPPNGRVKAYTTGTVSGTTSIALLIQSGTSFSTPLTLYPMLVKGTLTTSNIPTYEPYTNGASPNPDYPQDVNNVSGDNVVVISNKNLINPTDLTLGTISQSDGKTISSSTSVLYTPNFIKIISSQAYTLSYNGTQNATFRLFYYDEKKNFISTVVASGTQTPRATFTTLSNSKYLRIQFANTFNNNLQLETGTSATSFVAHQGNNFEINLGKNLLNNIVISQTKHGIAFTVNSDKTVYANGTAISSNALALNQVYLEKGKTYFLSGCPSGGGSGKYTLSINTTGTTTRLATDEGSGVSYTPTESGVYDISIGYWYGFSLNNLLFKPQLEEGTSTSYAPYFPPLELCKIGTYQDYIYKKDGKWWKHKEIGSYTFDGSESWTRSGNTSSTNFVGVLTGTNLTNKVQAKSISGLVTFLTDYFIFTSSLSSTVGMLMYNPSNNIYGALAFSLDINDVADLTAFQSWLSNNNVTLYYVLATPIEEEITYTPLIRQLDELYNSGLYDVTNISQDNSSEAFILDIEACKNNINGIVEYIRR